MTTNTMYRIALVSALIHPWRVANDVQAHDTKPRKAYPHIEVKD
jgi:hypothetical protein